MSNKKPTHCDKCHSKIINNECSCGTWYDNHSELPDHLKSLEKTLDWYKDTLNDSKNEDPFSGNKDEACVVFFKGDYILCEKVKRFIREETKIRNSKFPREFIEKLNDILQDLI